jgi:hypothetical protein
MILGGCLFLAGTATFAQFSTNSTNINFGTGIKQINIQESMAAATSYWSPTWTFTAFVVAVPAKGKITATLQHADMGSMFIAAYTKAQYNNVARGNATLRRTISRSCSFTNDDKEMALVYFVVSDVEHRSTKTDPYTVTFTRSWATPEAPPIPAEKPAAEPETPKN